MSHDRNPYNEPPLIKLGQDYMIYEPPSMMPYILMMFGAALILLIASWLIGPAPEPQELLGTDRDMREIHTP